MKIAFFSLLVLFPLEQKYSKKFQDQLFACCFVLKETSLQSVHSKCTFKVYSCINGYEKRYT